MDITDTHNWSPTTAALHRAFGETVRSLGGAVLDAEDAGAVMYARAVLPDVAEVRRGDGVQGGVAVRVVEGEIFVHPYILRQVCANGAVRTYAIGTRVVERVEAPARVAAAQQPAIASALTAFEEAVRQAAAPERFADGVREMRSAIDIRASAAIERLRLRALVLALPEQGLAGELRRAMMPLLSHALTPGVDGDRSAYAFANAVTAAAREVGNPALRWAMEEYGAAVFGATILEHSPPRAAAWHSPAPPQSTEGR
ncbi:MAG: hypothetical protein IT359_10315 [Gemmatimonadaceae bacterium]|nr:hypothetical protein [Gemmatimonadaceae bacterium]